MSKSVASFDSNAAGRLEAIHMATHAGGPMQHVERIRATAGVGLRAIAMPGASVTGRRTDGSAAT